MVMTAEDRFLSVADVAKRLNVNESAVRGWSRNGRLIGFRPGGKKVGWRVRESGLEDFIRRPFIAEPAHAQAVPL